ncbi:hypothetical protein BC830DRAFT_1151275 [Chytriomyces sp. MP71]|nr:hypothetical protein BC830DRAFT_1151275 [Chytriomyces sp. MP71]
MAGSCHCIRYCIRLAFVILFVEVSCFADTSLNRSTFVIQTADLLPSSVMKQSLECNDKRCVLHASRTCSSGWWLGDRCCWRN